VRMLRLKLAKNVSFTASLSKVGSKLIPPTPCLSVQTALAFHTLAGVVAFLL
jgi:hypothetical protein